MPKQAKRVSAYYLRDDGQLMIEVQPGQFVSETAARLGIISSSEPASGYSARRRLASATSWKNPLNKGRAGGVGVIRRPPHPEEERSSPPELH